MTQRGPSRPLPAPFSAGFLLISALLLAPASGLAQEMQINTYTGSGDRSEPDIARLTDGSFIVTWQSRYQNNLGLEIYARRLDAAGTPVGNEFLVSSDPSHRDKNPAVSPLDSGGFVIVWSSNTSTPRYHAGRIFDAAGNPVGNELTFDSSYGLEAELEVVPAGAGFAMAWAKDIDDPSGGIRFRRYDAAGTALGTEIQVSDSPPAADTGSMPHVLEMADGRFVVTWQSTTSTGDDNDQLSIQARFIDAAGVGLGSPFQVNTTTNSLQLSPSVVQASDGTLLFLWSGPPADVSGSGGREIIGQRVDMTGSFLGAELQASTTTPRSPGLPVATLTPNGLLIAWSVLIYDGFVPERHAEGRYFGTNGDPDGPQRRIAYDGKGYPIESTVAGRPLTIYEADRGLGSGTNIYVRPVPSFSMVAIPINTGARCQGDPLSFDLELFHDGGVFPTAPVTLSAPSFPGVTFDTNPATPPTTIGLTIDTSSEFSAEVLIRGSDGSVPDELLVRYSLLRNPPDPPTMLLPAEGATEQPGRPNFLWQPLDRVDAATFEIATDPSFFDVVSTFAAPSVPFKGTSPRYIRTPDALEPGRKYFWRMATEPVCPTNPETPPWSTPRSFRTSYSQYLKLVDPIPDEVIGFHDPALLGSGTDFALMYFRSICPVGTFECGSRNLELLTFAEPSGPPVESVLHACSPHLNLPCPSYGAIAGHPSKPEAFAAWLLRYDSLGSRRIQYRRFEPDGGSLGFLHNLDRSTSARYLDVATAETGSVIAWIETTPDGELGTYAQRVSPMGVPLGSPLLVASSPVHSSPLVQRDRPAVAIDSATGSFAVIWAGWWNPEINAADWIIEARFFDVDGNPLSAPFKVNVADSHDQRQPDITAGPDGSFLATWQSYTSLGNDDSGYSIQSRLISPTSPTGSPELQVNTTLSKDQIDPSVAYDPVSDQFLIAWLDRPSFSFNSSFWARRLSGAGVPQDSDFRIDNHSENRNTGPTVLADSLNANFQVVWQDLDRVIRRATVPTSPPFFQDGFESGDFTAWTEP